MIEGIIHRSSGFSCKLQASSSSIPNLDRSLSVKPSREYRSRCLFATTVIYSRSWPAPAYPAGRSSRTTNGWPLSSRISDKESVWPSLCVRSMPSKRYPRRGKDGPQSNRQKRVGAFFFFFFLSLRLVPVLVLVLLRVPVVVSDE